MKRHSVEIGKMPGTRSGAAQDPAEEVPLQDHVVEQRERRPRLGGPLHRARAQGDHEHQPEQRREGAKLVP